MAVCPVCTCVYVCVPVNICVHLCTCTPTCVPVHLCACAPVCQCTCVPVHRRVEGAYFLLRMRFSASLGKQFRVCLFFFAFLWPFAFWSCPSLYIHSWYTAAVRTDFFFLNASTQLWDRFFFVETHLCKLRATLRSRALRLVYEARERLIPYFVGVWTRGTHARMDSRSGTICPAGKCYDYSCHAACSGAAFCSLSRCS